MGRFLSADRFHLSVAAGSVALGGGFIQRRKSVLGSGGPDGSVADAAGCGHRTLHLRSISEPPKSGGVRGSVRGGRRVASQICEGAFVVGVRGRGASADE